MNIAALFSKQALDESKKQAADSKTYNAGANMDTSKPATAWSPSSSPVTLESEEPKPKPVKETVTTTTPVSTSTNTTVVSTGTTSTKPKALVVVNGVITGAEDLLTSIFHPQAKTTTTTTDPSTPLEPATAASLGVLLQSLLAVAEDEVDYALNPVASAVNIPLDVQTFSDIVTAVKNARAEIASKLGIKL